jgi:hypothetical protein
VVPPFFSGGEGARPRLIDDAQKSDGGTEPVTSPLADGKKKTKAKVEPAAADGPEEKKTKARPEPQVPPDGASRKTSGDEPVAGTKARSSDDAADAASKRLATRTDESAEGDELEASTQIGAEEGAPGRVTNPALAAARAHVGMAVLTRSLSFTANGTAEAPKGFSSGPVIGGRFEGEVYPLALMNSSSPLAGLGVYGEVEQALLLKMRAPTAEVSPMSTTQRAYSVGLRYRLALGHSDRSPALTVGVGYAARTYAVDRSALATPGAIGMPDVDYRGFDPGVVFRMPVGQMFAVTATARGFLATTAGPIQDPDQYGTTTILGGTASAGFEAMMLRNRIAVRVAGEATQLSLDFQGNGARAAKSGTDRYLGGSATVGVLY